MVVVGGPGRARVVWVSGAYGYGGELGCWRAVFREFLARFPRGVVPVGRDVPVHDYPELGLRPVLRFRQVRTTRRVGGVTYRGKRRVPTAGSLVRIARLRPDLLVLAEFTPTALAGFALARATRRRTLLLVESDPRFRGAPGGRAGTAVKRFVARRADAVQVSNEAGARFVRGALGVPDERLVVGPYLTSAPAGPAPAAPAGPVRFLFVNSVTARKGVRELLAALAAVPGGWELDVVGEGELLPELRRQAWGMPVAFHGRVPHEELAPHYACADVVVCPSLADYRSLAGFEAVNAARPVLVSRYDGAHEELAAATEAAVVVDPRDREAFAAALRRFVDEPVYRAKLAAAAQDVPARFGVPAAADNLARAVRLALR